MGNNIPKSTRRKNLRRSAAKMASKIAYTTMPSLSETISSSKQAFMDIKQFTIKGRSQLKVQNRYSKNNLLRPINEIIQNAKDDLKSGKLYNEERLMEAQSSSMSDFLGDMSGEEDNYEESNNDSMASFNKFMASTSASSMNSARAISDTQIKTTEYLGELSMSQHTQSLVMARQQHLEQLNKLDNLEKIGVSLAEFNTKTMSDHIKATHQFYNEILNETQELRKSIDKISKTIDSRYGAGSKKKIAHDAIGNVFGGGSFNLSGYFDEVKKNIGNQIPFSMDMIKGIFNDFKASPISGLMSLASGFMMPNGLKKGAGKLDKSVQGLFAQYLGAMDQWKRGKGLSNNDFLAGLQKLVGSVGAIDLTAKVNPDLSSYKNEAITLELEQKKAKAITEVIPSYLSQILNAVSHGKTNMYYNYDSGKFEDIKAAKEKSDTDFRKSIIYTSDNTTKFFKIHTNKLEFPSKEHKKAFEEDTETFLIYMYSNPTNDVNYIASGAFYNDMLRKGMSFKLGEFSVKMLKARWLSATPAERRDMTAEMMGNISLVKDISNRRDIDLQSSGKSSLYNNLYTYNTNKKPLKIDKDFQKQLLIQSTIPISIDESDIAYYREQVDKDLGREKKEEVFKDIFNDIDKSKGKSKFYGTKIGKFYKNAKNKYNSISNEIESKITKLTDTIADKTESILNGDLVGFDIEPVEFGDSTTNPVKSKAKKVARNTIKKNKYSINRRPKQKSSSNIHASSPATQAVMSSVIDYRPYFETLDSHLRNIATIISQDKALHVSNDTDTGSMTGVMSGASDKLKGIYGSGKESAKNMFNSLKSTFSSATPSIKSFAGSVAGKVSGLKGKAGEIVDKIKDSDIKGKLVDGVEVVKDKSGKIISNIKESGIKGKISNFASKAKESGLDILSKIASGISTAGGNVMEYFKSDSFKELLGGMKSKISGVLSKGKEFAGTLFDKIKSGGGNLLKKGKGMAIGGAISSMLGLGPIPGAIIGTLFSKNKKPKSSEDDKQLDQMEKQDSKGEGFLDKFKAKKKKSVLLGAGVSTMLGLGPIPGALVTMIFNKKFVKKNQGNEQDEQKQAEQIAEGVENAEKQSKGIGKGKKIKNLTIGAMASSILGLGPMPGVIAASIWNKHKDKAAKKKDKEDQKQAEGTVEAMDEATGGKKKGGIWSKIKNFFGKAKNIGVGAVASSLLGLGPIPGVIVASMYNKKKYKKKNDKEEQTTAEAMSNDETKNTKGGFFSNTASKIKGAKDALKEKLFKDREEKKKNKKYIEHAKQAREAEAKGNIQKTERLEATLFNKGKANGDIEGISKTQGMIADSSNNSGGLLKADPENPKKEGLLSKLGGLIGGLFNGGGGLLSGLIGAAIPILAGVFGKNFIQYLKDMGMAKGHGTTNEQGDANFGDWSDNVKGAFDTVKNMGISSAVGTVGKVLGVKGLGASVMGINTSLSAANKHEQEAKAYSDRYAETLAEEEKGDAAVHNIKAVHYGASAINTVKKSVKKRAEKKAAKAAAKAAARSATKGADEVAEVAVKKPGLIAAFKKWIDKLFKSEKVLKFVKKLKLDKAFNACKKFFGKNADNIISKIFKGAGKYIGKIASKLGTWYFTLATAIIAFINGWNNAARDLGVNNDTPGFWKARLANALLYAVDDVCAGVLDLIGLRDWIRDLLMKAMMSDDEEKSMKQSQQLQIDEYQQFLKDNDLNSEAFTQDMYNKMKHKSIWGHIKSAFGSDDLEKYKKGGKKNAELREKYGGYVVNQNTINIDNSENANVVMGDSSGSGGRGPSLANKPASQIIKSARDTLSKNIYSSNSTKLTDDKVNSYTNSSDYVQSNKTSWFSSLGDTIKNAAKWMGDKFSSGWNSVKSTVSGWFGGSGGRGNSTTNNNYTYYSQKDPKWANQTFGKYHGKRDTVRDGGCGPTVAAMALENLTGKQVLPSTMADLALKAGYKYDNGGTDPSFFNAAGSMYGVNFKQTSGFNNSTIDSLKAGVPVPLLGKNGPYGSGSHYLLATGMDSNGNVSILDPQNRSNNKKFPINVLSNTTKSSMVSTIRSKTANNKYMNRVKSIGRGGIKYTPTRRLSGRGITINNTPAVNPGYEEANRSKSDIKYIVIHYAANFDGKAASAKNWYNGDASAHYAVGTDGIYQTLDDKHIAYHCGGESYDAAKSYGGMSFYRKCTNSNSIGIEIASNSSKTDYSGDYWFDPVAINNAIALTNHLMNKYNIDKSHVVRHFDCSGKPCPAPMVPKEYLQNQGMTVNKNHDDNAWTAFKSRLTGKESVMSVGEALVAGMAALEGKIKYSYGSTDIEGGSGDCSATVQWVVKKVCGVDVGRSTSIQSTKGTKILDKTKDVNKITASAKPGDLLLWSDHVEMYAGDGYCWGNGSGIGTKKRTVKEMINSKSSDCQVRRYITGDETINTNLGTITDVNGNKVNITIDGYVSSGLTTSSNTNESQTVIQSILNSIGVKQDSNYSKIFGSSFINEDSALSKIGGSLLKTIGGTVTASAAPVNQDPTSYSKNFKKTNRSGTINLPDGLGKNSTYMGWQKITSPSSNQYKLREAAGMNFDSNGMGIIDGRYVVAVTPKFGDTGDYLTVTMSDGSSFKAIIGDIKGSDAGNEWGHNNGASVVEAVVDQNSWYNIKGNESIPWYGKEITSITNEGNYWGRGGRGNTASILPYKVKSNIASMRPSIPDRIINGRGGTISTTTPLISSKNALNNKNNIKITKALTESGRGAIDIQTKSISSTNKNSYQTNIENNKDEIMIAALQNIVSLLTDIRSSNKTISEKNFSPVIGVKSGSNGGYIQNSQKSALIDNIIAGI